MHGRMDNSEMSNGNLTSCTGDYGTYLCRSSFSSRCVLHILPFILLRPIILSRSRMGTVICLPQTLDGHMGVDLGGAE